MYGIPASAGTLAIFSAMMSVCTSLSMTHGPATRKRGWPPPRRKEPRLISLPAVMRSFEDSTEAGGAAKAARAAATYRHRGERKGEAREPLLVGAADDEVKDYYRIHGQRIAAPARTKNAELKPVNVEGRFESRKVADSRHHASANHLCGYSDSLANAVDGQVTLDSVGF